MELTRRSFLKLFGASVSAAVAAPAALAAVAPPKLTAPVPLIEELLAKDSLFHQHVIVRSAAIHFDHTHRYSWTDAARRRSGEHAAGNRPVTLGIMTKDEAERLETLYLITGTDRDHAIHINDLQGMSLDLSIYVSSDQLMSLAVAAHRAHDAVPLDLVMLRRAGVDQSKLRWVISAMSILAYQDQAMTLDLRLTQLGSELVYDEDDEGDESLVTLAQQRRMFRR